MLLEGNTGTHLFILIPPTNWFIVCRVVMNKRYVFKSVVFISVCLLMYSCCGVFILTLVHLFSHWCILIYLSLIINTDIELWCFNFLFSCLIFIFLHMNSYVERWVFLFLKFIFYIKLCLVSRSVYCFTKPLAQNVKLSSYCRLLTR